MKIRLVHVPVVGKPKMSDEERAGKLVKVEAEIARLDKILRETATPEQINRWIIDLCNAMDVKRGKDGEEYLTPAWNARVNGLDRVLNQLRYVSKEPVVKPVTSSNKIIIQVIDNKVKEAPKSIDVQEMP